MAQRQWAQIARDELAAGRTVKIRPRGHSMRGRIGDGDLVTLKPCVADDLATEAMVLARVKGRRYFHLVLHLIHRRDGDSFLIGSSTGRLDGWVSAANIFGVVTAVESEALG